MDPGRKCEEQQKERIYQSISSLFFLNEFEYCSFLPDRINSNNSQIKMKKYNPQNEAFRLFRTNRIIS